MILLAAPRLAFAQAQIDGRLTGSDTAPIVDIEVSVTRLGDQGPVATTRTSASGEFTFRDLAAGTYIVRAALTGLRPTERRITLNAAESVRLDLTLELAVAEEVTVFGAQAREQIPLDIPSETGSRLGLTARELPASVDVVTRAAIQERGFRTLQEAIESAVGVTVGEHPADDSTFTTRGFTHNQVPVLYDGVRIPVAMAFPLDAWNLDRVEVLKGPSSSLYGQGSVGGTVNYLFKRPDRQPQRVDGSVAYGGFNTFRLGLGAGGPLAQSGVHYRLDYSLNRSDGFIDRTPSRIQNVTSAVAWDVSPRLDLQLSFDLQDDRFSSYWGTPLVPAASAIDPVAGVVRTSDNQTIDRRLSRVNYNNSDDVTYLTAHWTKARAQWRPASGVAVREEFYYTFSDREWKNAETYAFNPATNRVDRDRFFVSHGVTLVGNRFDLSVNRPLGGFANRFFAGSEINSMTFDRIPFFRGGVDSVDPINPVPGVFGVLVPPLYTTKVINTAAFFAENYFSIRSDLKVAASVRAERIDTDHKTFNFAEGQSVLHDPSGGLLDPAESARRVFTPVTWRAGLVYDIGSNTSVYGHMATAADPVNADLDYSKPEDFDLARGRQVEVGAKQTLPRALAEWTFAYYWIERKNILTQTSRTTVDAIGKQSSRGVEFGLGLRPVNRWQILANAAFLDAIFDDFQETVGGVLVSRNGNRPANVPNIVVGLRSSYRFGDRRPFEIGASYRHIGDRFNAIDNSTKMLAYDLVDILGTWSVNRYRITVQARNVLDKTYAAWGSNFYNRQVSLGIPRTVEIALGFRF